MFWHKVFHIFTKHEHQTGWHYEAKEGPDRCTYIIKPVVYKYPIYTCCVCGNEKVDYWDGFLV